MIKTEVITGLGKAVSPIVHNEVHELHYDAEKGAAKKQRTLPIFLERDGQLVLERVPCVSGNSLRGLGRRLLVRHSIDELDIKYLDLADGNNEEAKKIAYFLENGGLTRKNDTPKKLPIGEYEDIQKNIPFLQTLGGVYQGHHFEGCISANFLIPMTQETYPEYEHALCDEHKATLQSKPLPKLSKLVSDMRYTRRASSERSEEKESMIYGTQVIAAGTQFLTQSSVNSKNDEALLAFRAMFWLIKEFGFMGGMIGRGHGKILFDFKLRTHDGTVRNLDQGDYSDYVAYIKKNKKDIKDAISKIPKVLTLQKK